MAAGGLTRRTLLEAGFCLCCLPSLARSSFAATAPMETLEVTQGVHVRVGATADATEQNQDAIANLGFVMGRDGVLVADPGGSLADGLALRAAIRAKTDKPIKYVCMSHIHPDHIFGAAAFVEDKPVFVGHRNLPEAMRQRGDYYRERLAEIVGEENAGTVVQPTLVVEKGVELDLGDRIVDAQAHATAHTTCDLTLVDRSTGALFTGDLVFVDRVPSLDGSLPGWLKELEGLKRIKAALAVPGHGPASIAWPAGAADIERYLTTMKRDVEKAIADGTPIEAASETAAQEERGRWKLFDDYNGRNAIAAYKELEWG
ncbi:quinoprotein relay system zinc metallohydrolase 2 [Methylocella sp.]|uniref:quinoprotein relay system zinc metallohydrolase 2 n=1 Tax=Methylocella sp. TaxID=1978226 RepID=UPI0035B30921